MTNPTGSSVHVTPPDPFGGPPTGSDTRLVPPGTVDLADLRAALKSAHQTMVFSSNDWSTARDFAWLYGIFVGRDNNDPDDADGYDSLAELAARFGWTEQQVERLKRFRAAVEAVERMEAA